MTPTHTAATDPIEHVILLLLENRSFDQMLGEFFKQDQTTIFDQLNAKDVSWKVYFYDFPSSLILNHQRRAENLGNYVGIDQFFKDAAHTRPFPESV